MKTLLLKREEVRGLIRMKEVIGTGNQARMQIRAINEIIKIEEIHAWDHTPDVASSI